MEYSVKIVIKIVEIFSRGNSYGPTDPPTPLGAGSRVGDWMGKVSQADLHSLMNSSYAIEVELLTLAGIRIAFG